MMFGSEGSGKVVYTVVVALAYWTSLTSQLLAYGKWETMINSETAKSMHVTKSRLYEIGNTILNLS